MEERVRIEELEKYIELIPGRLGFGCAPKGVDMLNVLMGNYGVNVIVNIRQLHQKHNVLWYKDKTKAQVIHIPLELPQDVDTRKELVKSSELLEKSRMVANILLKDVKKHVFIHGYDAYNYTAVFALLVWNFAQPTRQHFNPLRALEDLYGVDLACDFPSYERHREQVLEIIQDSKRDILSAFARVTKKPKTDHELQNGGN